MKNRTAGEPTPSVFSPIPCENGSPAPSEASGEPGPQCGLLRAHGIATSSWCRADSRASMNVEELEEIVRSGEISDSHRGAAIDSNFSATSKAQLQTYPLDRSLLSIISRHRELTTQRHKKWATWPSFQTVPPCLARFPRPRIFNAPPGKPGSSAAGSPRAGAHPKRQPGRPAIIGRQNRRHGRWLPLSPIPPKGLRRCLRAV